MKLLPTTGRNRSDRNEIEKNYCLDGLNIDGDLDAMFNQLEAFDAHLRNDESIKL